MENLIVASSNLVAIAPIMTAWQHQEYLVSISLFFAMLASIIYHLIETEKHQLPGFFGRQIGKKYHHLAINLDRLAAFTAISITLYRYHKLITFNLIRLAFIPLHFLLISEFWKDSYWILALPVESKIPYLVSHCIWHLSAFGLALSLVS